MPMRYQPFFITKLVQKQVLLIAYRPRLCLFNVLDLKHKLFKNSRIVIKVLLHYCFPLGAFKNAHVH